MCIDPVVETYFVYNENSNRQKELLQILTKCVNRIDVIKLGVVMDRMLQQAHELKSGCVGDILRFCTNAIAGNICLHEIENCESSNDTISNTIGNKLKLISSDALRSLILQGLHGSAPQDIRDISLEFIFCLFETSDCKWSLETTEETKQMKGLTIGQFAGLFCSILRGEMHLMLGEVLYLGGYETKSGDERGDVYLGKDAYTAEQKQVRMDRIG